MVSGENNMKNTLTTKSGALLTLHSPEMTPDIFGKAISLSPGSATRVSVLQNDLHRLTAPYSSDCVDGWPHFFPFQWQPYNKQLCTNAAKTTVTNETCGCLITKNSLNGVLLREPKNFNFCQKKDDKCVDQALDDLRTGKIISELLPFCRAKCYEETYEVQSQNYEFAIPQKHQARRLMCHQVSGLQMIM